MIFDRSQRDSEFPVNLPVSLSLEPVHRKNPAGPIRQPRHRLLKRDQQVFRLEGIFLLGSAWRIDRFDQRQGHYPAMPAPRTVDNNVVRDPEQKPAGIDQMGDLAAGRSAKKDLMREIGCEIFAYPPLEKAEQSIQLPAVDCLEGLMRKAVPASLHFNSWRPRRRDVLGASLSKVLVHAGTALAQPRGTATCVRATRYPALCRRTDVSRSP